MTHDDEGDAPAVRAQRHIECEQLILAYETDPAVLRALLPEPLRTDGKVVLVSFAATAAAARGSDVELRVMVPARFGEREVLFVVRTFLDEDDARRSATHIGLATRHAQPRLVSVHDSVCGVLALHGDTFAVAGLLAPGTRAPLTPAPVREALLQSLSLPQVQLRVLLDANGAPAVAQLIAATPLDVRVRHAWSGAAQLEYLPYPPAPLADLPVQQTLGGVHVFAAFSLGAVEVLHDYHGQARAARPAGGAALEGPAPGRRQEELH